mmetsp:Transcript_5955/g.10790  ORF Transcript_5955/g.10790 Transcript_5955/m.10790 type:complete len:245 (-) Transcript_5955:41-775(-)
MVSFSHRSRHVRSLGSVVVFALSHVNGDHGHEDRRCRGEHPPWERFGVTSSRPDATGRRISTVDSRTIIGICHIGAATTGTVTGRCRLVAEPKVTCLVMVVCGHFAQSLTCLFVGETSSTLVTQVMIADTNATAWTAVAVDHHHEEPPEIPSEFSSLMFTHIHSRVVLHIITIGFLGMSDNVIGTTAEEEQTAQGKAPNRETTSRTTIREHCCFCCCWLLLLVFRLLTVIKEVVPVYRLLYKRR